MVVPHQNSEEGTAMLAAAMGWIGTIGTITAYVMLTRGRFQSTSIRYAVLNFAGGLLAAFASAQYGAWPSVASNLIWSGVAMQSVLMTLRARDWRWAVGRLPYVVEIEPAEDEATESAEAAGPAEAVVDDTAQAA